MIIELTRSKSEIRYEPLPQDDSSQRKPEIRMASELLGWETANLYPQNRQGGPQLMQIDDKKYVAASIIRLIENAGET